MTNSKTAKVLVIAVWLIVLCGSGLYSALRIAGGDAFASNIMVLIPQGDAADRPQLAENTELQKNFLILVSGDSAGSGAALAGALRQALAAQPGIDIEQNFTASYDHIQQFFQPYRHQLLAPQVRAKLQNLSPQALADEAIATLYSPVQGFNPYGLEEDPFNLAGPWYQALFPLAARLSPGDIPALRDGEQTWHLLRGRLAESPFDLASQQAVTQVLQRFQAANPEAELLLSGFIFHAAEATATARRELSTVGFGSLLGIALLVILVFRSTQAVVAIGLTLLTSVVTALAVSLAIFGTIHLITLAFGSTLLGLSVDYCFHFLIKCRRHGRGLVAGRLMAKGLALSAGSTILTYLVQLLSPFPGLQQFAVFVASGLLGACLTVLLLAYCYNQLPVPSAGDKGFYSRVVAPFNQYLAGRRVLFLSALVLIVAVAVGQLIRSGSSDDIRLLNTSSAALVENEVRVSQLLGGIETQRYWTVAGDNPQQILQRTEQMLSALPATVQVMAASQLVPSVQQQQRDHQLVMAKLHGPNGALTLLCAKLNSDCQAWRDQDYDFKTGLNPQGIPPEVAEIFPVLAMAGKHHGVILPYLGQSLSAGELAELPRPEGVIFVDKVSELSVTLAAFRVEVSELLLAFLLVFALICLWLYRWRGLIVLIPVLVSLAAALASSGAGGITLFHVLALLLVTGIAIDAAVFYLELGLDGDTWLAATLAMLTSILAFGLLALSQVPVLHQFGAVVFTGLLCAWLVTPVLYLVVGQTTTTATNEGKL